MYMNPRVAGPYRIRRVCAKIAGVPEGSRSFRRSLLYFSRPAAAALTSIPQARPSFSMLSTCVQGTFMS